MGDAFDELERQLRRATAELADTPTRVRRRWPRILAFAALPAVLVSGGAVAAVTIVGGPTSEERGRAIAVEVMQQTATLPACKPADVRPGPRVVSDRALLPELSRTLPALAVPSSPVNRNATLNRLAKLPSDAAIVASSLRTLRFPQGLTVLIAVELGGARGIRDPAACVRARLELARERSDRQLSPAGAAAAAREIAQASGANDDDAQTLVVAVARNAGAGGLSGSGTPVRSGQPLRPGLLGNGSSGDGGSVYTGIARPGATTIRIRDRQGARIPGALASSPVRDGFFAVALPRGTGPVRLQERSASDAVLGTMTVRE